MDTVKLNFINQSEDTNNSSVVIYQKNVAESFGDMAVAWTVIKNCGRGDNHPFEYPMQIAVGASDSYGNHTPQFNAFNGQCWEMVKDLSGDVLKVSSSPARSPKEVEIRNSLTQGSINASCYRGGKLLAVKSGLAPSQNAFFEFKPIFYIGAVSQIEEGEIMNSAILSQIKMEINLEGIHSVDIVMRGGGSGPTAQAFTFTLENINKP